VTGEAEGTLYGGCLRCWAASLGTPYAIKTDETILFIEILGEAISSGSHVDAIKTGGKVFGRTCGIIFGEMLNCVQQHDQGYKLQEVVKRIVGDLGVPVAYVFVPDT